MSTIMQNLAWLSAFACLLLGLHLLRPRPRNLLPARLLGAIFMVMAFQSGLISLVLEYGRGGWALFLPSLALSLGPLLFLYFESVAYPQYRLTVARCLHFLPASLCLLQMSSGIFWIDPDLMIVFSFAIYTFALVWRMTKGRAQFSHSGVYQNVIYLWLMSCVVILAVSLLNEVFILYELAQGKPINQSIGLFLGMFGKLTMLSFTLLIALQTPSPFDWLTSFEQKTYRPEPESLEDLQYRILIDKFDSLLEEQKSYTQDGVSLKNIARFLDVSQRQLSQAINHVHGESFSKHMNRLRVKEAKRLLTDSADNTIVEVMLDSGFRTKSNFNKEFLAIEGMSPSDFRKANS